MAFSSRLKDIKKAAIQELTGSNICLNEARVETLLLIEHVFGLKNKDLLLNPDIEVPENKVKKFNMFIKKRLRKKIPVQYLINTAYFMSEAFYVDKNVLIPRPETEILVEEVIKRARKDSKIIDIGTGSGCIAIMLAKKLPQSEITASDISQNALKIAKINAEKLGVAEKINFIRSDIFKNIDKTEKFDIIVSNPPYIPSGEKESLQAEVLGHEPPLALFVGDKEGISFYKELAQQAASRLNPKGMLAVEVGFAQAGALRKIFELNGFEHIEIIKDMSGIERVVTGFFKNF